MLLKGKIALAYTAGIIDGEGYVGLIERNRKKDLSIGLRVSASNTKEWLIQWLKMQYGGYIHCRQPKQINCKPNWTWQLDNKKAFEFLELVLPYLQIKHPQAEIAVAFYKTQRWGGGRKGYSSEEKVIRQANYLLVKALNKKGVEAKGS
jgi:hypothetical protein